MPKINPDIPENSVQYFSNARGVYYLPSLETEWKNSGYLPRVDQQSAIALQGAVAADVAAGNTPLEDFAFASTFETSELLEIFTGANGASIWHYYNEADHEKSIKKLKELGINCVRTPLNYHAYDNDSAKYLNNVKSFLRICDRYKIRVQFILWDAEYTNTTLYSEPNKGPYSEPTTNNLVHSLIVEHPRNPFKAQASSTSFFTTDVEPYLDDLAQTVSSFQSMWCFDLCSKPIPEFNGLALSSYNHLNTYLSSTNVKYTVSPSRGLNVFNSTNYLDNGKGTGPSGSFDNTDIQTLSGVIDFVSVPFIVNNDYAFKRYLNGALQGATDFGISKPFMVYASYDPEVNQNFNITNDALKASSIGYFNDVGIVDGVFSLGKYHEKYGNVYWDGQYKDVTTASSLLQNASAVNWYNRKDLTKFKRLKQKGDDSLNSSGGFFSGIPNELEAYNPSLYVSTTETRWSYLKKYYTAPGPFTQAIMNRLSQGSKTFRAPFDSVYNSAEEYNILESSFYTNTFEENLKVLYDFSSTFPPLSSYTFSVGGSDWQAINKTMVLRNQFLQNISKFIVDYDSNAVGYAELRNSEYDTNPIPHYERENLVELVEFMTNPHDLIDRNPTTSKLGDLSSTYVYNNAQAFYGVSDNGSHFSKYYDEYYSKFVEQLKKCLMWIYWKGTTDSDFKIVSDSFLDDISFVASSLSSVEVYTSAVDGDDYVPGSLTSVQSPLYRVEVWNPSLNSWENSFVFVASGQSRQVVASQANSPVYGDYWSTSGSRAPVSYTTFGTSGIARVRVKGPFETNIRSWDVYPKRHSKYREPAHFTFGEGDGETLFSGIEFTTYIGDKIYLNVNDTPSSVLCIFSDPFKPSIPEGLTTYAGETRADYTDEVGLNLTSGASSYYTVNWNGNWNYAEENTQPPSGLYFPPGVHYVSAGLPLAPSSTVYIDANAYVIGGFDVLSGFDSKIIGRGVISAELYPRSFIEDLKSDINNVAPNFYTPIGYSLSSADFGLQYVEAPGTISEGICFVNQAFYATGRLASTSFNNCKAICPWTFNSDGFKTVSKFRNGVHGVTNSFMLCGDDVMTPFTTLFKGPSYYRNIFAGSMRGGVVAGYFGGGVTHRTVVRDIDVLSYNSSGHTAANTSFSPQGLITIKCDYQDGLTYNAGLSKVTLEDWDIQGGDGSAIAGPMYHIANEKYIFINDPGATQRDAMGVLSGITLTNINISPSTIYPLYDIASSSTIIGTSAGPTPAQIAVNSLQTENRPIDITFTNFKIGPNSFLTDDNVDNYTAWLEPLSATVSVTDPDSVLGADSNIVFKTT